MAKALPVRELATNSKLGRTYLRRCVMLGSSILSQEREERQKGLVPTRSGVCNKQVHYFWGMDEEVISQKGRSFPRQVSLSEFVIFCKVIYEGEVRENERCRQKQAP